MSVGTILSSPSLIYGLLVGFFAILNIIVHEKLLLKNNMNPSDRENIMKALIHLNKVRKYL